MPQPQQLKRVSVWAKELNLTRDRILEAINLGHLKAKRLGIGPTSPWYCNESDINEWLDSRTVRRRAW